MRLRLRPALAALLLVPVAGCGGDPQEDYCAEVESQRADLSEAVADGGPTALIRALPVFEELEAAAPRDIRDDWQVVIDRVGELAAAVDDAGVDPASYDGDKPPAGVSEDEQARIAAAARALTDAPTVEAFAAVQQHARDICKTSLTR